MGPPFSPRPQTDPGHPRGPCEVMLVAAERQEGRKEGIALAILLAGGLTEALHRYARGAGIPEKELEALLSGPLCVMFRAVGRRMPTFEEELDTALGEPP